MTSPSGGAEQTSAIFTAQHGTEAERRQAIEHIVAVHWKPLYKYSRFRHNSSPDDTQLLLKEFFEELARHGFFKKYSIQSGPLRTFLRAELDRFHGHWKGLAAGQSRFPIEYSAAEEEFKSEVRFSGLAADEYYEREWVRNLFTLAVAELQNVLTAEGKDDHFLLFFQNDLQDRPAQDRQFLDEVANKMGIPINDAMNALAAARQRFHQIMKEIIRSLTLSDEQFQQEMRAIFRRS